MQRNVKGARRVAGTRSVRRFRATQMAVLAMIAEQSEPIRRTGGR